MSAALKLVNLEKCIEVSFQAGIEPKELLRLLTDAGYPGSIGVISLRALLTGTQSEVNGFIIIADGVAADQQEEVVEELLKEAAHAEPLTLQDTPLVQTESEQTQITSEPVIEEPVHTDIPQEESDSSPVSQDPPNEDEESFSKEDVAAALQKGFGINLTPTLQGEIKDSVGRSSSGNSRRPRRDMSVLLEKAKKGQHKELLEAAEAAGYVITNVENSERWFRFTLGAYQAKRTDPGFDVSPLKSGATTISLYINDRSVGVKAKVWGANMSKPSAEDVIAKIKEIESGALFEEAMKQFVVA